MRPLSPHTLSSASGWRDNPYKSAAKAILSRLKSSTKEGYKSYFRNNIPGRLGLQKFYCTCSVPMFTHNFFMHRFNIMTFVLRYDLTDTAGVPENKVLGMFHGLDD